MTKHKETIGEWRCLAVSIYIERKVCLGYGAGKTFYKCKKYVAQTDSEAATFALAIINEMFVW